MPTFAIDGIDLHYECLGNGPPVLLVHGSVMNGEMTWAAQQPLAERWRLIVIDRPGFGASSATDRVDFAVDAGLVAGILDRLPELCGVERAHLVGHSYGGVVSLLAAAMRLEAIRSLTVIEPPAFGIAAGDAAADDLVSRLKEHWQSGPRDDPAEFLRRFRALVGSAAKVAQSAAAAARTGRGHARRGARTLGGGNPDAAARRCTIPEACRLGRTRRSLRCNLRCA